jgi:signal transduction histidine kinase
MIILKISLFFILLSTVFYIFIGKKLTRESLKELTYMSEKAQDISLEKSNTPFTIKGPAKDEIRILSETLNKMLGKIESQAKNLKQFTTDMSHEFKTPLMVMSSHIDLIEKKYT